MEFSHTQYRRATRSPALLEYSESVALAVKSAVHRIERRLAKLHIVMSFARIEREVERTGGFRGAVRSQQRRASRQLDRLHDKAAE